MIDNGAADGRIMVLGVGNLLLKDDGIGVHTIRELQQRELPENVTLVEAGTAGHQLLSDFSEVDHLIVVDAVEAGAQAGAIFRFSPDDVPGGRESTTSLHQMSLLEVLEMARVMGSRPQTVIIGVQAADVSPWGTELTPEVAQRLPEVVDAVLAELRGIPG